MQVYQLRTGRKLHLPQFPFEEHTSTALELNSVTSSDEENSEDKENIGRGQQHGLRAMGREFWDLWEDLSTRRPKLARQDTR